jgi:2-amino-4-hydroxy-6-hydroxymethyldihydropteridine diphosphokinase
MTGRARQALIGVGANVGDRWALIRKAEGLLAATPGIDRVELSAPFETVPVGGVTQPAFLNLALGVETVLAPEELLAVLLDIERILGRDRSREVRWGPRTLDLDILLFEGEVRASARLILPHPRMWERSFVLVPLRHFLEHSPHFSLKRWEHLAPLLTSVPDDPGVRLWSPPGA